MSEFVSWLMIEKGWRVVASDGSELGHVDEIAGDSDADIFDGLAVDPSIFEGPRYVIADQVGQITQGVVQLKIGRDEFERLESFSEPPPSIEIDSETAPRSERWIESFFNFFRGFRRR